MIIVLLALNVNNVVEYQHAFQKQKSFISREQAWR
jgi:hypothetical protein